MFTPPLVLVLQHDRGMYIAADIDLGIFLYARKLSALPAELAKQMDFLWHAYVTADPLPFGPDALALRDELLARVRLKQKSA